MKTSYIIILLFSLLIFSCSTDKPAQNDDTQSQSEPVLLPEVEEEPGVWDKTTAKSFIGVWKLTSGYRNPTTGQLANSSISITENGQFAIEYSYDGNSTGFRIDYVAESKSFNRSFISSTNNNKQNRQNYSMHLIGPNQLSLTIDPNDPNPLIKNDIYTRMELKFVDKPVVNNTEPFYYGIWKKIAGDKNPNSGKFLNEQIIIEKGNNDGAYMITIGSQDYLDAELVDDSNTILGGYSGGVFTIEIISKEPSVISLSDDGQGGHFEPMVNQKYRKVEYVIVEGMEQIAETAKEPPRELKEGEVEIKGTIIKYDDTGIYGLWSVTIKETETGNIISLNLQSDGAVHNLVGFTTSVYYTSITENDLIGVQHNGIDIIGSDYDKSSLKQVTGILKGGNEEFGESSDSPGIVGIVDEDGNIIYASLFIYSELFAVNNKLITGFYRSMSRSYISYVHRADISAHVPGPQHIDIDALPPDNPSTIDSSPTPENTSTPESAAPEFKTLIHAPAGDFSNAHEDIIMNYVSWDGQNWTAKVKGNTFIHALNGDFANAHEDVILNYVLPNKSKWTAKVKGTTFTHALNGDFSKTHDDVALAYVTWGGGSWTMKIKK